MLSNKRHHEEVMVRTGIYVGVGECMGPISLVRSGLSKTWASYFRAP